MYLILELMSTVECYDCHEMVQDLKAHRLVASVEKQRKVTTSVSDAFINKRGN
jgi:6-phosphogluconolactonase (cycloisomerase 2 family)